MWADGRFLRAPDPTYVEYVSFGGAYNLGVALHEGRLPVHHHRVVLLVQEFVVAVITHRLPQVREVGLAVVAAHCSEDELSLHGVINERGGEVGVAARGGPLARAVSLVV